MPNTILLKRSLTTATPGSLANGEFAYSANGDVAFFGSNGAVVAIGGKRTPGVLTANQAMVVNSTSYMDVVRTANLFIGSVTVNVINAVSNSTVLGTAANNELTTTWAIKTYVDSKSAGVSTGGSNTQVQFNNSGAFGASAGFTFDSTSNTIAVGNSTVNSIMTPIIHSVRNASGSANVTPTGFVVGSSTQNSSGFYVGTSVVNTTSISTTDITISGNLTINGTLTTVDATNLQVKDSIIELSDQQLTTDTLSIGVFGNYGNSTVTQYSGLFRDQSDSGIWKLFNTRAKPTTTVDTANNTYAQSTLQAFLKSGSFVSNSTVVNITANSTVSSAIAANTLTLTTALGIASGGSGLTNFTLNSIKVGNGTSAPTLISGTDGQVLQSISGVPTFAALDAGTF